MNKQNYLSKTMETGQDKSTTGAIHFATRDPQSTPPPFSSLPSTTQWDTTTTPSHTWRQHADGRRTGEEWRRFGERRRRELLEKDERDGGTHFRIHKRCKILKYFALAERVMQQFLDVFNHGHGRNSEETYLMGHRLWVFASSALPRHPEYMSSAVAPQRHANVQNMGRIQQCMVQLALQIDEEQLNKYITNDFDPVVLDEEEEGDDESTSSSSSVPEIDLREFQEDTSGPALLATTATTTTPTTTTTTAAKDKDNGWERFTGWSFLTTSCAPWSGHDQDDFAPGAVDTDTASHDWSGSADLSSESETDSEAHEPYFPSLAAVSEMSAFTAKKHNVPERDPPPHAEKPDASSPRKRKSVHFKEPLEEIEEPDDPELVFQYVPLEDAVIIVDDHDVVDEGEGDVDSQGQEYLFDFHESAFLQQVASEDVPYESDSEAFDSWAQEEESDILTISSGTALTCDPARLAFREIMNRVPREDPTWVRKLDAPSNVKTPTSTTPPRQLPASTSAEALNASTTSPSSCSKNPRPDYSPSKRLHNRHHWASFDFATVRRSFEPR